GTFVDAFVREMRRYGDDVRVVVAIPVIRYVIERLTHKKSVQREQAIRIPVWSLSTRLLPGLQLIERLNLLGLRRALTSTLRRMRWEPDIFYAQFLTTAWAVADSARSAGKPCVVALGESGIQRYDRLFGADELRRICGML